MTCLSSYLERRYIKLIDEVELKHTTERTSEIADPPSMDLCPPKDASMPDLIMVRNFEEALQDSVIAKRDVLILSNAIVIYIELTQQQTQAADNETHRFVTDA